MLRVGKFILHLPKCLIVPLGIFRWGEQHYNFTILAGVTLLTICWKRQNVKICRRRILYDCQMDSIWIFARLHSSASCQSFLNVQVVSLSPLKITMAAATARPSSRNNLDWCKQSTAAKIPEQGSYSKTSIKCNTVKNGEQEVLRSFHLNFSYATQDVKNSFLNPRSRNCQLLQK